MNKLISAIALSAVVSLAIGCFGDDTESVAHPFNPNDGAGGQQNATTGSGPSACKVDSDCGVVDESDAKCREASCIDGVCFSGEVEDGVACGADDTDVCIGGTCAQVCEDASDCTVPKDSCRYPSCAGFPLVTERVCTYWPRKDGEGCEVGGAAGVCEVGVCVPQS